MSRNNVSKIMQIILVAMGVASGFAYYMDTKSRREEYTLARATLNAAHVGRWVWDTTKSDDCLDWDDNTFAVFGADKSKFRGSYRDFAKVLHPDDLHRVTTLVMDTVRNGGRYAAFFRVVDKDGGTRHIAAIGAMLEDKKTMAGIVILKPDEATASVMKEFNE